jgi:adenine-specific DNA-methyltransferase
MPTVAEVDSERLREQARLDNALDAASRNRLGQFATPPALAADLVAAVQPHLSGSEPLRFLEPAVGSGAFVAALLASRPPTGVEHMVGIEKDPRFADVAARLWGAAGLRVLTADFTTTEPFGQFNLLLANPPYVRHHHIPAEEKRRLQTAASAVAGEPVSGLAGLYVHFLLLADKWLAPGAIAAWLIPGEVLDVNYGRAVRQYLRRDVELLRVHRFAADAVQFTDALVSSAVIIYRKTEPSGRPVRFTFGASVGNPSDEVSVSPSELTPEGKWGRPGKRPRSETCLGDIFTIRRGLATGCNDFFVVDRETAASFRLPLQFLRPILPSPRHLASDVIESNADGSPRVSPEHYLLDCQLPEWQVEERHPELWGYLRKGVESGVSAGYLCSRRTPWYSQENRPPAPFVVPYMGRGRGGQSPFRFIRNRSRATAANVYLLMYPRGPFAERLSDPHRLDAVHSALRQLGGAVAEGGRVYGGGLLKVEPGELAALPAAGLLDAIGGPQRRGLFDDLTETE